MTKATHSLSSGGHGDPSGGIRHPAWRGGGDDPEAAGGEELGRRGWEMASHIRPGGVGY